MQLGGKLFKPSDLVGIVELLNGKGEGCFVISFTHPFKEVKFCVKDNKVYVEGRISLPAETFLKILIENWWFGKRHPNFKILKDAVCSWNAFLSVDRFKELILKSEEKLRRLQSFPEEFVIEKVKESGLPQFLKAAQLAREVVTLEDLHSHGIALLDLLDWIDEQLVVVKPYREKEIFNLVFKIAFSFSVLLVTIWLVIPNNYVSLLVLKSRNEILNKVLAGEVVGKPVNGMMIPDCNGKVVIKNGKVFIRTKFGKYFIGEIPRSGYIPFFEVPAK